MTPLIFIDGDACPVKEETAQVAARYDAQVKIVSHQGMRPLRLPHVTHVTVGSGFDAADDWIVEQAQAGDIVITADIPLAARCVKKHCKVLGPNGHLFTPENISTKLAVRDLNAYLREAGEIKGFNPSFTKRDRSQFLQSLDGLLQRSKA